MVYPFSKSSCGFSDVLLSARNKVDYVSRGA